MGRRPIPLVHVHPFPLPSRPNHFYNARRRIHRHRNRRRGSHSMPPFFALQRKHESHLTQVAVGAAFYFGTPRTVPEDGATETEAEPGRPSTSSKKGGKKNKKKTIPGLRATSGEESTAAEEPVAPKRVEKEKEKELTPKPESVPSAPTSKPKKKKKSQNAKPAEPEVGSSLRPAPVSESSSANDGAWTRVETRRRAGASARGVLSDGVTTSVTGTEDEQEDAPQEVKQRTLAERMLPAGRKTGVEE